MLQHPSTPHLSETELDDTLTGNDLIASIGLVVVWAVLSVIVVDLWMMPGVVA